MMIAMPIDESIERLTPARRRPEGVTGDCFVLFLSSGTKTSLQKTPRKAMISIHYEGGLSVRG